MILDKTTDGKEINLEFAHEVVKKTLKQEKIEEVKKNRYCLKV